MPFVRAADLVTCAPALRSSKGAQILNVEQPDAPNAALLRFLEGG